MQLGGIGGEHNAAMHQVTHCGHSHSQRQGDIAGGLASSAADVAAQLQHGWTERLGRGNVCCKTSGAGPTR